MTVIDEKGERGYWHEVFDNVKGSPIAKTLALLYLSMREDYAYNIAAQFKKLPINVKALKDQSQLQPILKDFEEKSFLVSRKEKIDGRDRKYFFINPQILYSPDGTENYPLLNKGSLGISYDDIKVFLCDLSQTDCEKYLKGWDKSANVLQRSTEKYDFITFLLALQEEARIHNRVSLAQGFDAYIVEIQRLEREKRREHILTSTIKAHIAKRKDE